MASSAARHPQPQTRRPATPAAEATPHPAAPRPGSPHSASHRPPHHHPAAARATKPPAAPRPGSPHSASHRPPHHHPAAKTTTPPPAAPRPGSPHSKKLRPPASALQRLDGSRQHFGTVAHAILENHRHHPQPCPLGPLPHTPACFPPPISWPLRCVPCTLHPVP